MGKTEEGLTALTANETIGVLSHVGSRRASGAFLLQLLDLTVGLNREVLKNGLGALLVSVGDLLGCGVDLLLSLSLATLGVNESGDSGLGLETTSLNRGGVLELSGTEDDTVDTVFANFLNLRSTIEKRLGASCS